MAASVVTSLVSTAKPTDRAEVTALAARPQEGGARELIRCNNIVIYLSGCEECLWVFWRGGRKASNLLRWLEYVVN